jgi:hypothetical protein
VPNLSEDDKLGRGGGGDLTKFLRTNKAKREEKIQKNK